MNYTKPEVKYLFEQNAKNPAVKSVYDLLEYYDDILTGELPNSKHKTIHIISMAHSGNYRNELQKELVIESQTKLLDLLTTINPNAVGIEGFHGENYTLEDSIVKFNAMFGFPEQSQDEISKEAQNIKENLKNDPDAVISYYLSKPDCRFTGVEYLELNRLSQVFQFMIQSNRLFSKDPRVLIFEATSKLRSLMAIVKFSSQLKNEEIGVIPMGYKHIEDILLLKENLNATWQIHSTVNDDLLKKSLQRGV